MALQKDLAGELHVTHLACVGFGVRVTCLVLLEVAGLREGCVTLVALVGFLSAVGATVDAKVGRSGEGHATHQALKGAVVGVYAACVGAEVG